MEYTQTKPDYKSQMSTNAYRGLSQLVIAIEQNFNILNNGEKDPQVILDAWGTEASQLFADYQNTINYLAMHLPNYIPLTTTNTFTFNQDGTVTFNKPR